SEVTLGLRSFLGNKEASGHPVKNRVLNYLITDPATRLPMAAKFASVGQTVQNKTVGLIPAPWRKRLESPLLRGQGPDLGYKNLQESLKLGKGWILTPDKGHNGKAVFYFPGCGASLFYRSIGQAAILLLLKSGVSVVVPPKHMCCGYPLLASGCDEAYRKNRQANIQGIRGLLNEASDQGLSITHSLTSCGTCRGSIEEYGLGHALSLDLTHQDVVQFVMTRIPAFQGEAPDIVYHQACHSEWSGVPPLKAGQIYAGELARITGSSVTPSPGCCGESGMGALTSPEIYNLIRSRKREYLERDLYGHEGPLVVGCPSCKVGISRTLKEMKSPVQVLHTVEYLAELMCGERWDREFVRIVLAAQEQNMARTVSV
ncbi:MAG: (Fe-S)-binding protein, partial [Desulfovibrionales bacterium]